MKNMYSVKEVLKILGICRSTLHAWENKKYLSSQRHPLNNYRFFNREEIEKLAKGLEEQKREE